MSADKALQGKKVLVIGSTVVDIIVELIDHLPKTGEDVHVRRQRMSLGGCAFNVSDAIRHFGVPCILFSPVGTGVYGRFVEEALAGRGVKSPIPTPDSENGCCYCFVESTGERSFVSYHGAEYLFQREWFDLIDTSEIGAVYICGLEIEEETGVNIVEFLERNRELPVFFAPGPRLLRIREPLLRRIYALHPVLHLNETEAMEVTGKKNAAEAAEALFHETGNAVFVTLGERGCHYRRENTAYTVPAVKTVQTDTIGAGDAHIGTLIACYMLGIGAEEAIQKANRVSAAVVSTAGALLPDERFKEIMEAAENTAG